MRQVATHGVPKLNSNLSSKSNPNPKMTFKIGRPGFGSSKDYGTGPDKVGDYTRKGLTNVTKTRCAHKHTYAHHYFD